MENLSWLAPMLVQVRQKNNCLEGERKVSAPRKADVNKLDNPAWSKANHQARTELCA
jgi:hypothetical protein